MEYRVTLVGGGTGGNGNDVVFLSGTSIGNKKIGISASVSSPVSGTLRLEVVNTARKLPPIVKVGAYAQCKNGVDI